MLYNYIKMKYFQSRTNVIVEKRHFIFMQITPIRLPDAVFDAKMQIVG
jgi:hypothetical protein